MVILVAGLLAVAIGGCVQRPASSAVGSTAVGPIFGSHVVSQSFVPGTGTLSAVDVRLATYVRQNAGLITLHVRREQSNGADLRTAVIAASDLKDNELQRFSFPPIAATDGRLVVVIDSSATDQSNAVTIWSSPGAVEPADRATYDGRPLDARLALAPVYQDSLFSVVGSQAGQLVAAGSGPALALAVIFLPGLFLAALLLPRRDVESVIAAAPAFGVAGIALAGLWGTQLGVPLGRGTILAIVAASLVGLGVVLARRWGGARDAEPRERRLPWAPIAAMAVVALGLAIRSFALDGAPVPPGGDAFHHVVITQLFLDHGAIPSSYIPYAPITTFAYHFGFHIVAAAVAWATADSALHAVLVTAVLLNGLIALSVFYCARTLGLGDVGSVLACVLVALVSPFPAALLDIARYPQTAGMVILPVAAGLLLKMAWPAGGTGADVWSWRRIAALALLGAGLFLAHYRIALALGALGAVMALWLAIEAGVRERGPRAIARFTVWFRIAAAAGLASLVLVAPWILRLVGEFTLGIHGSQGRYGPEYFSIARLGASTSHPAFWALIALGIAGAVLALRQRHHAVQTLALWAVLLVAFSSPYWAPVPGAGALDSVTVLSSVFFPLAVGVGLLGQRTASWLDHLRPRAGAAACMAIVSVIAIWGGLQMPGLFAPDDRLAEAADLDAGRWMAASLPSDAKLLVNSAVRKWSPDYVVPTDGGYWMPLLAHKATTLLPLVYPGERGVKSSQIDEMERLSRATSTSLTSADTLALLRSAGVTHVYVGVHGGPIDSKALDHDDAFRRVYERAGVAIYELKDSPSPATAQSLRENDVAGAVP